MADSVARSEIKDGTKQAGFVRGKQNKPPRWCENCIWMGFASCGHPIVVSDPDLKLNDMDRVPVDGDDCCDNFQSLGNVILWIVRHGSTHNDQLGKHGGWQDDPLDAIGRKDAEQARKYLEGKKFKHVFSSDMSRAHETAKIIAPGHGVETDKVLRPWDVGIFTGKDHDLYKKQFKIFLDHPAREIPQGESFAEYAARMHKALLKYITYAKENGPTLVVTHSRNFSQFKKQIENKNEFEKPEDWDKVAEGGIMAVLDEDGELKCEIVWNRGDEKELKELNFAS